MNRYGLLEDGRVIDVAPLGEGKPPVVFNGSDWVTFEGTFGDVMDAKPISDEEAERLTSSGIAGK